MTATRILVSVRDIAEAALAADEGVDFIDLKDPAAGALGGLPPDRIAAIVRALRGRSDFRGRISATIGDWPAGETRAMLDRVAAVAATGVDYVKVGLAPGRHEVALIDVLARCGATVVPVLIADDGIHRGHLRAVLAAKVRPELVEVAFPAVMLDTEDKRGGSLLQRLPRETLRGFCDEVRDAGAMAGLAGALRLDDWRALHMIGPDFAGFRSAVCVGDRAGAIDAARLRALRTASRGHADSLRTSLQ
jgi:(5-formylfuran-3-yl)methyl phosphate synthase